MEQVRRVQQQFFQRVLPVLGRAANGVEKAEMAVNLVPAEFLDHGRLDAALDLLGFAAQHGGLVGHAHGLEMQVGVEPG